MWRGLNSKKALRIEMIRETCLGGPGHQMGSDDALSRMQRMNIYPG